MKKKSVRFSSEIFKAGIVKNKSVIRFKISQLRLAQASLQKYREGAELKIQYHTNAEENEALAEIIEEIRSYDSQIARFETEIALLSSHL